MNDLDERPWFVFQLPGGVSYAPGATEADARRVITKNSYERAPVDLWPCIGSRFTSRDALARSLLRPRTPPPIGLGEESK